jgi:hypothetical protein
LLLAAGSPAFGTGGSSGVAGLREKIGMTISHRSANWSYRTTASPLLRISHGPPNPLKMLFVGTAPYSTLPVVSNWRPFFAKIAIRVLTI